MEIFHSQIPHILFSEFRGPRILNFAGEDDAKGSKSQGDDPDELDPTTPAGKKWKLLREEKKKLEDSFAAEREARIKAEARAEAFDEFKAQFGTDATKKKGATEKPDQDDDAADVNPADEAYVAKILDRQLRKAGLDQIPDAVNALKQSSDRIAAESALDKAKRDLEEEFQNSVPFDFAEALKFAKERNYGMIATTAKEALRMAHKEMNEEAFIEHYRGGDSQKKKAPKMIHSGRGDSPLKSKRESDDEIEIGDFSAARLAARAVVEDDE